MVMMDDPSEIKSIRSVVARGVAISAAGNLSLRFLDMGIAVLLLRLLSIFEFGLYQLALATYNFATSFFLSGLENVVVNDVSQNLATNKNKARAIFTFYAYFLVLMALALWAVFFFGSAFLRPWIPVGSNYLKIISFLFLLAPLETVLKMKFQILLDFGWATAFRVLRDISRIVVIVGVFWFSSFGVVGALWSLVGAVGIPIVIALIGYRRQGLLKILNFAEIREAASDLFFRHGKWALLDDFVSNSGSNIHPFLIRWLVGTEAVALFAVAQKLYSYTLTLFPIREILTPILPRVSDDLERLKSHINKATKYATVAFFILAIASAIGAPVIVYILFPKYIPSLPLFYILLFGMPWFGFRSVVQPIFYAKKAQKILFLLTIVRIVMITGLGIVLMRFWGIWGAAFEMMLVGILLNPPFARALKTILPGWQFEWKSLCRIDDYDKTMARTILRVCWNRIRPLYRRL